MDVTVCTPVRRDSLGLVSSLDLLEDVDFESTMMVLEHSECGEIPLNARRRFSSMRRGSMDQLELSLTSLAELFPTNGDTEELNFLTDNQAAPAVAAAAAGGQQGDLKIRLPSSRRTSIIAEFPHSPTLLSPTMDSFLRDSWGDINDLASKTRRTSSKLLEGLLLSPTGASPRRLSTGLNGAALPGVSLFQSRGHTPRLSVHSTNNIYHASAPGAVDTSMDNKPARAKGAKARSTPKQPRRAKQCVADGCVRRAQSNNRCKTHGGGARCQMPGCDKSSQGGGLCRAHGGGKKCGVTGCTKGTQRLGLCYLHGGIRRCIQEGCKKKDRGNGYCISHGGGRRCEVEGCTRSVRKGNHCQTHHAGEDGSGSPFNIVRGHKLHLQ